MPAPPVRLTTAVCAEARMGPAARSSHRLARPCWRRGNLAGVDHVPGGETELAALLRDSLRGMHIANSETPVAGVSDEGAFLDPLLLGSAGPPVVLDANWLHDDVLRFCGSQQQTTMITAANSGLLRLYCAGHVLNEVEEHSAEWALKKGLAPAVVREAWERTYLPLLRWVDPPTGLLTPREQERMEVLLTRDRDDVPSATLALLLQAPLISSDKRPTEAVYGPETAARKRSELLEVLRLTSDMVQLGQMGRVAAFVPFAASSTLLKLAVDAAKANPLVALLVTGAVGYLVVRRVPDPTWRRIGASVTSGIDWGARDRGAPGVAAESAGCCSGTTPMARARQSDPRDVGVDTRTHVDPGARPS